MYAHNIAIEDNDRKIRSSICPILLVFAIIAGTLILGLGLLRFYSFRLEYQLARINDRIASYEKTISKYEQHIATLKSPSRIHNFASINLGMQGTSDVSTVIVASNPGRNHQSDLVFDEENKGLMNLVNIFTRPANADD